MILRNRLSMSDSPFSSHLFDEKRFFEKFIEDLNRANSEVIIESPFSTEKRVNKLDTAFRRLVDKGIKTYVILKHSSLLDPQLASQTELVTKYFENIGIQVLLTSNNHHRKLAIIDRKILWEGSLNILSQSDSREIMRRIDSEYYAQEMFTFLGLGRFI